MKKLLIISGVSVVLIITIAGVLSLSNQSKTGTNNPNSKNQVNDSIPLLVMGSYLYFSENISLDSLKIGLETGKIACTNDIKSSIKERLKLTTEPKTISLNKFNFKSRNDLVITTLDSVDQRFLCKNLNNTNFFKTPKSYPLWIKYDKGDFSFEKEITSYTHTGVTALTRASGRTLDSKGIDFYLQNILSYFKTPEIVHISNEVSYQDTCFYESMKMRFATKKEHFEIFNRLGVDIVELTGNHNLDVGEEPYLKSLKWYKDNGMNYFGGGATPSEANKPLVRELKDKHRIAWIGFNELCPCSECADTKMGSNRYSEIKAKKLIDSLKNQLKVDYIIACVQYGEVDSYKPTTNQKKICQKLIDFGADVVIGSQAHQAQEIALYKNKTIFYGLGNFMFDQIHRLGVRQAFFLECYMYNGKIIQFQPVYTFMNENRQPTPANAEEKREIQKVVLVESNF